MKDYKTPAEMMDGEWFKPRNSPVSGDMVMALERWYGIPPVWTLAIIGAETAMAHGDPKIGGKLVWYNNFGCVKWAGKDNRWGELSTGWVLVGLSRWYKWPDPWTGMVALGRLLKVARGGYYLDCIKRDDRRSFTGLYYGRKVSGYEDYHARWLRIFDACQRKAAEYGWTW